MITIEMMIVMMMMMTKDNQGNGMDDYDRKAASFAVQFE